MNRRIRSATTSRSCRVLASGASAHGLVSNVFSEPAGQIRRAPSSMTELAQELEFEFDHAFLFDSHPAMVARSLSVGIGMFAGTWKLSVLWYLEQRSRRFRELASLLPGVTAKVLTYQLRELEEVGLIRRTETIRPRHTEYAL